MKSGYPISARLAAPTLALAPAALACDDDFVRAGERFLPTGARDDFAGYVSQCAAVSEGRDLPPGRVAQTTYFLVVGDAEAGEVIGLSSLRHTLTPPLEDVGGHIGYRIRPSTRRKGYGTLILELTLAQARILGLQRALLTCDRDNIASARVIQRNGGVLASEGYSPQTATVVSRYWIEVPSPTNGAR